MKKQILLSSLFALLVSGQAFGVFGTKASIYQFFVSKGTETCPNNNASVMAPNANDSINLKAGKDEVFSPGITLNEVKLNAIQSKGLPANQKTTRVQTKNRTYYLWRDDKGNTHDIRGTIMNRNTNRADLGPLNQGKTFHSLGHTLEKRSKFKGGDKKHWHTDVIVTIDAGGALSFADQLPQEVAAKLEGENATTGSISK